MLSKFYVSVYAAFTSYGKTADNYIFQNPHTFSMIISNKWSIHSSFIPQINFLSQTIAHIEWNEF